MDFSDFFCFERKFQGLKYQIQIPTPFLIFIKVLKNIQTTNKNYFIKILTKNLQQQQQQKKLQDLRLMTSELTRSLFMTFLHICTTKESRTNLYFQFH